MRFISQFPEYRFQARPQRQRPLGDGSIEITQEPIYCTFGPLHSGTMMYENEIAAGIKSFDFRGNTQEQDEATPSDLSMRLSVFDTDEAALAENWDEDTKLMVEARLIQLCQEAPSECVQVTTTPISAPFPRYDEWDGDDVEQLVVKLIEDGHDLPTVLHYERAFGMKRQRIIDALEQTIEAQREMTVPA
jgi:hypothetical protein